MSEIVALCIGPTRRDRPPATKARSLGELTCRVDVRHDANDPNPSLRFILPSRQTA